MLKAIILLGLTCYLVASAPVDETVAVEQEVEDPVVNTRLELPCPQENYPAKDYTVENHVNHLDCKGKPVIYGSKIEYKKDGTATGFMYQCFCDGTELYQDLKKATKCGGFVFTPRFIPNSVRCRRPGRPLIEGTEEEEVIVDSVKEV